MISFSLSAVMLAGLAMAFILPALLGRRPLNRDDSDRQNIRIARRRLEELEQGVNAGDDATRAQTRAEIEGALLDDLGDDPGDDRDGARGRDGESNQNRNRNRKPPGTPGKVSTALILALIPLLSAALYLTLGEPAALLPDGAATAASPDNSNSPAGQVPPVETLVRQLEQKLAANPGDADGWALAGRTYGALGQFAKAARAYRTLHQLVGDDPDVLTAWADAEVMANNGAFTPAAQARIERALTLAPAHYTALWLAALGAETRADYPRALGYLERLLPLAESNPQAGAEVARFIDRMRRLNASAATGSPAVAETETETETEASAEAETSAASASGRGSLTVQVQLDPALGGGVRADQRVYVFARAVEGEGPPMPLAVSRHRAADLPVTVTLDDSMAMVRTMKLSDFARVSVMARLSRSGNPVAAPGDIESRAVITRTDNKSPLNLVINRVVGDPAAGQ